MNKEKRKEKELKKEKRLKRKQNFQILLSFIGAIYFIISILLTTKKDYSDSKLFPFILGFTILYIIIFIILVIINRKNKKKIKDETKNFKNNLKLMKLLLNVFFIGSSLLIFIESLNSLSSGSNFFVIFELVFSGLLLLFKLLFTISKIVKMIKKKFKKK